MKAYIVGPYGGGEGSYCLIAEDGEGMCSHYCSSAGYAYGDLYGNRPERKEMFDKKGITEVVYLEGSDITDEEITKRNNEWHEGHSVPKEGK